MLIKELRDILSKFPDEYQVIVSSDSEGNGFRIAVDCNSYHARKPYYGDIEIKNDEDLHDGEQHNCVVIW